MRVFFAIEFEEKIKDKLYLIQQEVKKHSLSGNFSHRDNFHLTLRFIGEQSSSEIETLKTALHETAESLSGFTLSFGKPGDFNKGNKKIVWMGISKSPELQSLYLKLESVLAKYGYEKEGRPYSPHITLVREARMDGRKVEISPLDGDDMTIVVKSISLMDSKRVDNKLTYTAIEKAALL